MLGQAAREWAWDWRTRSFPVMCMYVRPPGQARQRNTLLRPWYLFSLLLASWLVKFHEMSLGSVEHSNEESGDWLISYFIY